MTPLSTPPPQGAHKGDNCVSGATHNSSRGVVCRGETHVGEWDRRESSPFSPSSSGGGRGRLCEECCAPLGLDFPQQSLANVIIVSVCVYAFRQEYVVRVCKCGCIHVCVCGGVFVQVDVCVYVYVCVVCVSVHSRVCVCVDACDI